MNISSHWFDVTMPLYVASNVTTWLNHVKPTVPAAGRGGDAGGRGVDRHNLRYGRRSVSRLSVRAPSSPALVTQEGAGGRRHFMTSRQRRSWIPRRHPRSGAVALCACRDPGAQPGRNRRQEWMVSGLVQAAKHFLATLQASACGEGRVAREPESG
jgi:hypothetical protein